ncbi:MAG TPA: hypothetical protein VFD43_02615 [Planctomycetota bacterium]|nr:hypothetical protein [Planctomycetota bacterium]
MRTLRALLYGVLLACLLGGDCHWAFSSNTSGDDHHHDDGGGTVIVTNQTSDGEPGLLGGLDLARFELGECVFGLATREEVAAYRAAGGRAPLPLLRRVYPWTDGGALLELSPAQLWPPGRIGDRELAAFAAAVLRVNEERLRLPVQAAGLRYLDTRVADGLATVRFEAPGPGLTEVVSASFGPGGELVVVELSPGDRTRHLR